MTKKRFELPDDVVVATTSLSNPNPVVAEFISATLCDDPPPSGEGGDLNVENKPSLPEKDPRGEDPPGKWDAEQDILLPPPPVADDLSSMVEQNDQNEQNHDQDQQPCCNSTPVPLLSFLLRVAFGGLFIIGTIVVMDGQYNYGYPTMGLWAAAAIALSASQVIEFRNSSSSIKLPVLIFSLIGSTCLFVGAFLALQFSYYGNFGFQIMIIVGGISMVIGHGLESISCFCSKTESNGNVIDGVPKLIAALGDILFIIGGALINEPDWYYTGPRSGAVLLIVGGLCHIIYGFALHFKWSG